MNERQKQLKAQYKERKLKGGIYRIVNQKNGRFYLGKAEDMDGPQNRFIQGQKTGGCSHPCLLKDWNQFGKDAFVFEVLETWEKDATQTDEEYRKDLNALLEIWSDKLGREGRY